MIGRITCIETTGDPVTSRNGNQIQYLRLHILYNDGKVQQLNTDRNTLQALCGNTPDNETKSKKWDIGYYIRTTRTGRSMTCLQYMTEQK